MLINVLQHRLRAAIKRSVHAVVAWYSSTYFNLAILSLPSCSSTYSMTPDRDTEIRFRPYPLAFDESASFSTKTRRIGVGRALLRRLNLRSKALSATIKRAVVESEADKK